MVLRFQLLLCCQLTSPYCVLAFCQNNIDVLRIDLSPAVDKIISLVLGLLGFDLFWFYSFLSLVSMYIVEGLYCPSACSVGRVCCLRCVCVFGKCE